MKVRNKGKKNKDIYRQFSRSGAARLRADRKAARFVRTITENESVTLMKYARSLLFPWSISKLRYALQEPVSSLEEGYGKILDTEIPSSKFIELFSQSAIFNRLATMDYEKRNSEVKIINVQAKEKVQLKKTWSVWN